MILMAALGAILVVGVVLTLRWGGLAYRPWVPGMDRPADGGGAAASTGGPDLDDDAPAATVLAQYLRGVAVVLVAGFWAGVIVTGPAVRLIMRLLAVTGGDDAQRRITEADEVVGEIDLGGTIGLIVFGGILVGLFSAAVYVVARRWLPAGRLGGVTFGALHFVVLATRADPLRPDNPDFDLVGPGWLSVLTFGLAALLHGMAVAAFANSYSRSFPPATSERAVRVRAVLPLVLPALLLIPGAVLFVPLVAGLVVTLLLSRVPPLVRAVRSHGALVAGRVAAVVLALVFLPGTVADVHDVIVRDDVAFPAP